MLHDESTEDKIFRQACRSHYKDRETPTNSDLERAERASRMVQIKVAKREFAAAHAAITLAERDYLETLSPKDPRKLQLAESGLDVRTVNHLEEAGIFTVEQLAACSEQELRRIPNFGDATIRKIHILLEALGMYSPEEA